MGQVSLIIFNVIANLFIVRSEFFCGDGWLNRKGTYDCYKVTDVEGTWGEIEKVCQSEESHLTSIEDLYENMFIASFEAITADKDKWIGLKVGNGSWSDQSELRFTNWKDGESSDGDCGAITASADWTHLPCEKKAIGICKKNLHASRYLGKKGDKECGYHGWFWRAGTEYCYKETGRTLSWKDSENLCDYWGGHLTSIVDKEEQDYVMGETWSDSEGDIWIGLHKDFKPIFSWSDGKKFKFSYWTETEAEAMSRKGNGTNAVDKCVKLNNDFEWEISDCEFNVRKYDKTKYSHARGICKKDLKGDRLRTPSTTSTTTTTTTTLSTEKSTKKLKTTKKATSTTTTTVSTTTTTTTTTTPSFDKDMVYSCDYPWIYMPNSTSCYTVSGRLLNWRETEDVCQSIGGHLASSHDIYENQFIYKLGWLYSNNDIWLGLNDVYSDVHRWTDESRNQYRNWLLGSPNKVEAASEGCAKMLQGGKWLNVECSFNWRTLSNYRYEAAMGVCKKPANQRRRDFPH